MTEPNKLTEKRIKEIQADILSITQYETNELLANWLLRRVDAKKAITYFDENRNWYRERGAYKHFKGIAEGE